MSNQKNYFFRGIIFTVIAAAVPLLGLLIYAFQLVRHNEVAATYSALSARAEVAAQQADNALERARTLLDYLASKPQLQSLERSACRTFMQGIPTKGTLLTDIALIGLDGIPVCLASEPHSPPVDFNERPWFKASLAGADLAISKPHRGILTRRWNVVMTRAVRKVNGDRVAVLAVAIDMETLAERLLTPHSLPKKTNFGVVMADGTVMTINSAAAPWIAKPLPEKLFSQLERALAGPVEVQGIDDIPKVVAASPLRHFGMHAVVSVPRDDILMATNERAKGSAALASLILIAACVLSWRLARRLSTPIRSLTQMAHELRNGNAHAKADETLPGEFAILSREINKALEAVRQSDGASPPKAAAQGASKPEDKFLAIISHEINAPVNAIAETTSLALRQNISSNAREYIAKISKTAENLRSIIKDTLDISRIETGASQVQRLPFAVDHVLERSAAAIDLQTYRKHKTLLFDVDSSVPDTVVGDPWRLQQVLVNLCINALNSTAEGEAVLVTVRVVDHASLRFSVNVRSETQLGLPVCRELVRLMQGSIGADTLATDGRDTFFTLPYASCVTPQTPSTTSPSALAGRRALVLDETEAVRCVLSNYLKHLRLDVVSISTQAQARGHLMRGPAPDFVIASSSFPGIDELIVMADSSAPSGSVKYVAIRGCEEDVVAPPPTVRTPDAWLTAPFTRTGLTEALCDTCPEPKAESSDPHSQPRLGPPALKGTRVLLVEDNEFNQIVACDLLGQVAGMEIKIANDGDEALQMLSAHRFDLILMDVQMPGMDGRQVSRKIRDRPEFAALPIIAMTASSTPSDRHLCLQAGMDDFVTKPFVPNELFTLLARWVESGRKQTPPNFQPTTRSQAQAL